MTCKEKRPTDVKEGLQYLSNRYRSFLLGPEVNNSNLQQSCSRFVSFDAKTRRGKMLLAVIFPMKSSPSHCLLRLRDKEISVHVFVINADLAKAEYIDFLWFSAETAAKEGELKSYEIKFSTIAKSFLGLVPTVSAHQSAELTNANEPTWCYLFIALNYRKQVDLREASSDPSSRHAYSRFCCLN